MKRILLLLNILILAGCSELNRTRDEITQNAQVYEEDAFNTIDGAHDPTLINTNVEWMQENMNRVDYEPRKSRKTTKKKATNLEKFTE